jgi:hypothetical protein
MTRQTALVTIVVFVARLNMTQRPRGSPVAGEQVRGLTDGLERSQEALDRAD